jgi:hypothetical protein
MRETRPTLQRLLDDLRKKEHEWKQWGRWYHLAIGLLTVGGNVYILFQWNSVMQVIAELLKGADPKEQASTIYLMGLTAVGYGALLLFGLYELSTAWRYWNGNDLRQGVIAYLEACEPRVDDVSGR